jgi:hypothetical protein
LSGFKTAEERSAQKGCISIGKIALALALAICIDGGIGKTCVKGLLRVVKKIEKL